MSITSSLHIGVTGLLAHSRSLSVIGNNVANVNTIGYKATRAEFANLLSTLEGNVEIGRGVILAGITPLFLQGALQTTGNVTDLAIQGRGLFIVRDSEGSPFYTRAGQFHLDKNGILVNPQGFALQGFPVDETGKPLGGLGDIVLDSGQILPASATTSIGLVVNLNAAATTPTGDWPGGSGTDAPPGDWLAASNFSTIVTVYDSLGQAHELTFLFRKTDANTWEYRAVIPIVDVQTDPTDPENWIAVGEGSLVFNDDGTLDPDNSTINDITISGFVNGAADLTVLADDLSFVGSTQFARASSVFLVRQDGFSAGTLTGIAINAQGLVIGQFSNGSTRALYQIALADFPSEERLANIGGNLFAQTFESGNVRIVGTPGTGVFGSLVSGGLELSTVDITQEFANLISSQRGFQANSRMITVADQMYDEVVNLKR
ncbi:MAG: flagellar hook protein FlgE [Candidatus Binatia bacterium]|nr:flagellar hook protein FlgE [Candidatus Binatia bacterium]